MLHTSSLKVFFINHLSSYSKIVKCYSSSSLIVLKIVLLLYFLILICFEINLLFHFIHTEEKPFVF